MKNKLTKILTILLIGVLSIVRVNALSYETKIIERKVASSGEDITVEGDYDSLRAIAGNKVTNKSNVDGITLIAGNSIIAEGNTTYGFYAGNNLKISENVEKDAFVAGNSIIISENANVGRDLYIAGNDVVVATNIPRDLRVGGSTVDISGITIEGNAYIAADKIILDENTNIVGRLKYPENAKMVNLDKAQIGEAVVLKQKKAVIKNDFKEEFFNFVISFCAAVVTLIVLFYVFPKVKTKLEKLELNLKDVAKTTGIGFLVLIVFPIIALIAVFTGILTPLALILIGIYITMLYLSILFVGYIVGDRITKKWITKDSTYLSIFLGILIVKLVGIIPRFGGLFTALILFYGLGIICNLIKPKK